MQTFASLVQDKRIEKNMSKKALAEAAEISRPYLWSIETGEQIPSLKAIVRLAGALKCAPVDLIPGSYLTHTHCICSSLSVDEKRLFKMFLEFCHFQEVQKMMSDNQTFTHAML